MARTRKQALVSKAETAATVATYGATVGGLVGGPTGAAVGAGIGGVAGLIYGDEPLVFSEPMIIIPARQDYLLSGTPDVKIYAHAGETLMPTGGNVDDTMEGIIESEAIMEAPRKKRRKLNAYQRFNKSFNYRAKRKSESPQDYMRARAKAVSRAWKKSGGRK